MGAILRLTQKCNILSIFFFFSIPLKKEKELREWKLDFVLFVIHLVKDFNVII